MELVTAIALHMMSSTDDHEGKYEADVDVGRSNPHLDRRLKKSSLFLQAGSDLCSYQVSKVSRTDPCLCPPTSYHEREQASCRAALIAVPSTESYIHTRCTDIFSQ